MLLDAGRFHKQEDLISLLDEASDSFKLCDYFLLSKYPNVFIFYRTFAKDSMYVFPYIGGSLQSCQ